MTDAVALALATPRRRAIGLSVADAVAMERRAALLQHKLEARVALLFGALGTMAQAIDTALEENPDDPVVRSLAETLEAELAALTPTLAAETGEEANGTEGD